MAFVILALTSDVNYVLFTFGLGIYVIGHSVLAQNRSTIFYLQLAERMVFAERVTNAFGIRV